MEEFDLRNFTLIDKAITLVAPRGSGKTHLISDMLLNTMDIRHHSDTFEKLIIIIICQSLIDANQYFQVCMYSILDKTGFIPTIKGHEFIKNFKLKDHINRNCIQSLVRNESDHVIKTVINTMIEYMQTEMLVIPSTNKIFTPTEFYFNGSVNKQILTKLNNAEIRSNKPRKYIVIIDDVKKESYLDIKNEVVMIYEQGRHHDTSVVVIDQYIKSKKVPPEIRSTSSHLIFRSFDETIRKEIIDICAMDKNEIDVVAIKELVSNYYAIVVDFSNRQRLFYFRSAADIFENLYHEEPVYNVEVPIEELEQENRVNDSETI